MLGIELPPVMAEGVGGLKIPLDHECLPRVSS